MGPERNGRVRGASKAVAPSDIGLARSNVQKKKEDKELQATISNMQGEINDLKEQLTEMDQIKTQLTEMDQMKAQLKEMDQLKVQLTQMDQMKTQIAFLTQAFTGRNNSQSSIHLCVFESQLGIDGEDRAIDASYCSSLYQDDSKSTVPASSIHDLHGTPEETSFFIFPSELWFIWYVTVSIVYSMVV
ncbi:hypothetical protein NE237_003188 [Protea cynaroides]|uniref:Uncharacterized protein n=1 Tax=Protea cynaroides TaxID=273540 RepID=A0A9Q0KGY8_9MAGN|nr:hypothetical protein NE237_003188 [Protea cynaroides]